MTAWTLQAPMPEMTLPGGTFITFEAIDPATGAAVVGVQVGTFSIYGYDESADTTPLEDVVPLYSPSDVGGPV